MNRKKKELVKKEEVGKTWRKDVKTVSSLIQKGGQDGRGDERRERGIRKSKLLSVKDCMWNLNHGNVK